MAFWRSYAHLVWATKNREKWIKQSIEERLYAQISVKAASLGCYVYAVNGTADHIHLILAIPPKRSVSDVVKTLKGASAHFVNHVLRPSEFHFVWQRGYGYLTLGQTQLPRAIAYVDGQKKHHADESLNTWLERFQETEDGPSVRTETANRIDLLKEDSVGYEFLGNILF